MNIIKRITSLVICIILTATALSGCSGNTGILDFIYPIDGNISSFDPQVASTSDEFLIVENCFEGLVRVNDDGTVIPGVATDWSISDDGLTYTFNLRKGAKWNTLSKTSTPTAAQNLMGEDFNPDITANDFVFALQRAADPDTNAPLYSSISGIENATDIHSKNKTANQLGVKAIDDYTLEIRLTGRDDGFMTTLSTAIAMPCNEKFFYATKGRYGLGLENTIFNGQFYVNLILDTSYTLKQNSAYVGDKTPEVTDITLTITDENTDIVKNLKSGYYDSAYISGEQYEQLENEKISATAYSNKIWAFLLNKNKLLFSNQKLRQALCLSISEIDNSHPYFENAISLIPPSCIVDNQSVTSAIGQTVAVRDSEKAKDLWREGLVETGYTVADLTVIVPENMEDTAKAFVQGIQGGIGQITTYGDEDKISFSLKLNVLNSEDYQTAFSKGDYDIALYQFTANNQNPLSFIEQIINGNYVGEIQNAQSAINDAKKATYSQMADAVKKCEETILNDYSIYPVLFESSYYAQAKGVSGVQFHPGSGRINFIDATRED